MQLLPSSYRRLLYWLLRVVQLSEQQEKALEAIITFWFPQTLRSSLLPFLQYALQNSTFLFLQEIPEVTAEPGKEEVEEGAFSMRLSFNRMHQMAAQKGAEDEDLDWLYLEEKEGNDEKEVVWIKPMQLIQSIGGVSRPNVPPKPDNVKPSVPPQLPPKPQK